MHNGEYEFDRLIKSMEREVLDLKTAHQRPLGTLNFFSDELSFTVAMQYTSGTYHRDFEVVVTIAEPIAKPPIVQAGWDTPSGFTFVETIGFSNSGDYTTWTYQLRLVSTSISSVAMKFGVVSSQPIENLTWSYL